VPWTLPSSYLFNIENEMMIKTIVESQSMFTDHTFGRNQDPADTDYKWIRATRLHQLTDDEGDVNLWKGEYVSKEGEVIVTNDAKEYTCNHFPSTLMDACLGNINLESDLGSTIFNIEYIERGLIIVRVFANGEPCFITIDDFLPCIDNYPVYCMNRSGALWQSLMEKAYAKVVGSYEKIQESRKTPADLMRTMLGAPTHEFDLGFVDDDLEEGDCWSFKNYVRDVSNY
jgi:hypothetical protein